MDLSNIRVTTKVAVNALLGDTPTLVEYGTALMHNLGTREVKAAVRIQYCFINTPIEFPSIPVSFCQFLSAFINGENSLT